LPRETTLIYFGLYTSLPKLNIFTGVFPVFHKVPQLPRENVMLDGSLPAPERTQEQIQNQLTDQNGHTIMNGDTARTAAEMTAAKMTATDMTAAEATAEEMAASEVAASEVAAWAESRPSNRCQCFLSFFLSQMLQNKPESWSLASFSSLIKSVRSYLPELLYS
jgi:hypothetical protein